MAESDRHHSNVFSFHDSKKHTDSIPNNNFYNQNQISTDRNEKKDEIYELKNKINKYNQYELNMPQDSYNVSSELRLINVERRLEKNEKLLYYFEEMLRLKDDEKKNDILIDKNIIKDITKRVSNLEDNITIILKKFNEFSDIFTSKIEKIEKLYTKSKDGRDKVSEFYASKLSELEGLLKKNDIIIDNKIEQNFIEFEKNMDVKIEDMLNLVNEVTKIGDSNEYQNLENKDTIRMIQSDHIDFIKIVGILKEKTDSLDYVYKEITDLKQKYQNMLAMVGEQCMEDDKILNNMFSSDKNENC
jgi:hypothetical protein